MLSRRPNRGLLRDRELFAKVRCERWGWSNFCMCLECGGLEVVMQGGRKHDDVQLYRTLQSPALTGQKWASSPLMQHTSNDKEVTFRGLYPNIILSQSPPGRCAWVLCGTFEINFTWRKVLVKTWPQRTQEEPWSHRVLWCPIWIECLIELLNFHININIFGISLV